MIPLVVPIIIINVRYATIREARPILTTLYPTVAIVELYCSLRHEWLNSYDLREQKTAFIGLILILSGICLVVIISSFSKLTDPDGNLLRSADFGESGVDVTLTPNMEGTYAGTVHMLGDEISPRTAHVTYQFGYLKSLPTVSAFGFIGYLLVFSGVIIIAASYYSSRSRQESRHPALTNEELLIG